MEKVIITGYTAKSEGVVLETNIPASLKNGNTKQKETYVSWDKIGKLLFDNYTDAIEVSDLRELRGFQRDAYPFSIQGCPGYEGYIPENLGHKVCKYCGSIKYYH